MTGTDLPNENDPYIAAANEVNNILIAHKQKWNGDDEIQDMLAEAFVRGVRFESNSQTAVCDHELLDCFNSVEIHAIDPMAFGGMKPDTALRNYKNHMKHVANHGPDCSTWEDA